MSLLATIPITYSSICLETFIFANDETGNHFASLLSEAAERGIKVRLIYDAMGSLGTESVLFDSMRRAGVQVNAFGSPLTYGSSRA